MANAGIIGRCGKWVSAVTKKERQLKGRQLVNALRHNSGTQKEKIRQELIRSNFMAIECFDCIRFIGNQGCCGRDNQIKGYNQCYGRERQHSPCLYFEKMERGKREGFCGRINPGFSCGEKNECSI